MMRALVLLSALALAGCAGQRETMPPADVTGTTVLPPAAVQDEPVEGRIPDGITPLTKEQEDAVSKAN